MAYNNGKPRAPAGQAKQWIGQYHNARTCALQRGIDWQFDYDSWVAWWGEDIHRRGPRKGQLVMARHRDQGPYHPDNVRKATCSENLSEGQLRRWPQLARELEAAE